MNKDYLNESKWIESENITIMQLDNRSNDNNLTGFFEYFTDESCGCLYTAFFIDETTLSKEYDFVKVNYNLKSESEEYAFALDKDGACDGFGEETIKFSLDWNFQTYDGEAYGGAYLSAIEFIKLKSDVVIDLSLNVNGHRYKITKGIVVQRPTTTKAVRTTLAKTTKQKTTKAKPPTKQKTQKTERTKKQTTTKFVPKVIYQTTKQQTTKFSISKEEVCTTAESNQEQATVTEAQTESEEAEQGILSHISRTAKIILIIGVLIGLAGLMFILKAAFTNTTPPDDKENEEE